MLTKSIEDIISKTIKEYNSLIIEKHPSITEEELEQMWNIASGSESKKKTGGRKKKTEEEEDEDDKTSVSTTKSKNKNVEGGCPYVFIKGKEEGKICNSKPKDGGEYCSKHSKCEGVGQKEKKKIPVTKKTVASKVSSPKRSPPKKPTEKVLRMNKEINKFWHPQSGLLFDTVDNIVEAIGSYKDGKLHPLTSQDIANCELFGFRYPKKSLSEEIVKTNLQSEHIENVLNEIGLEDEEDEEDEEEDEGLEDIEEEE